MYRKVQRGMIKSLYEPTTHGIFTTLFNRPCSILDGSKSDTSENISMSESSLWGSNLFRGPFWSVEFPFNLWQLYFELLLVGGGEGLADTSMAPASLHITVYLRESIAHK